MHRAWSLVAQTIVHCVMVETDQVIVSMNRGGSRLGVAPAKLTQWVVMPEACGG